jgi:hypothetical protein
MGDQAQPRGGSVLTAGEQADAYKGAVGGSAAPTKQQAPRRLICGGPALLLRWDRLLEQRPGRHACVGERVFHKPVGDAAGENGHGVTQRERRRSAGQAVAIRWV